jgi:hypothetical protein
MAMDEPGEVAPSKGRLLMGDGIEGDRRLGDDPLAIGSRNRMMLVEPFSREALGQSACGRRTDLVLGFEVDAWASRLR